MQTNNLETSDVAVFWDYENCHSSSQVSGYEVVSGIRNVAHRFGSVKYFKAYMEMPEPDTSRSLSLRSELQSSGVSLTDCPHNGRKNVADQMMIVDMMAYAMDHPAPATLILISGDRDFAYPISVLRLRRYQIVVISLAAHISLKSQASVCLDWNADVMGYPNSSHPGYSEPISTTPSQLNFGHARRASYLGDRSSLFSGPKADQPTGKIFPVASTSNEPVLVHPSTSRSAKEPSLENFQVPPEAQQRPEAVCVPAPAYSANTPQTLNKNVFGMATPMPSNSPRSYLGTAEAGPAPLVSSTETDSPTISTENGVPLRPLSSPILLSPRPNSKPETPTPDTPPVAGPSQPIPAPAQRNGSQKMVAPQFQALVDVLAKYKAKGVNQPLRSVIGYELVGLAKTMYQEAGAHSFGQFTALAEQAKIVQLGGRDGKAWISIHRGLQ
ncbi:NYN domain-containing protein [Mycena galericulata]|nr:NYN domain-containing protein [Mycena galericulata]